MKFNCPQYFLLLLIMFFHAVPGLFSQTGISGKVTDAKSRQPLEYVSVFSLNNPLIKTVTDQN